jgi:hypothetical protein
MNVKLVAAMAGFALIAAVLPVTAHHSFSAEYDSGKRIAISGTLVKFEWTNPHSWTYVEVTQKDGKKVVWRGETLPVNLLFRQGWTREQTEKLVGQQVTITGPAAKDGSTHLWAESVRTDKSGQVFQLNGKPPVE